MKMRFHFDFSEECKGLDDNSLDDENIEVVMKEAVQQFGEILQMHSDAFSGRCDWHFTVSDDRGSQLLKFMFSMARFEANQWADRSYEDQAAPTRLRSKKAN